MVVKERRTTRSRWSVPVVLRLLLVLLAFMGFSTVKAIELKEASVEAHAIRVVWNFDSTDQREQTYDERQALVFTLVFDTAINITNTYGLTRIRCGRRLFESKRLPGMRSKEPLIASSAHDTPILSQLLSTNDWSGCANRYIVALVFEETVMPVNASTECVLRVLLPDEQLTPNQPAFLHTRGIAKDAFFGSVSDLHQGTLPTNTLCISSQPTKTQETKHSGDDDEGKENTKKKEEEEEKGEEHKNMLWAIRNGISARVDQQQRAQTVQKVHSAADGVRLSDMNGNDRAFTDVGQNHELLSLIQTSSKLRVGFMGIIEGLLKPPFSGVASLMGSGVVGEAAKPIGSSLSMATATEVIEIVGDNIDAPLINEINKILVPGLTETIPDYLQHYLEMDVGNAVPEGITPIVTNRVTESLKQLAADSVSQIIEEKVPSYVANRLTHDLGIVLSHSLASSLVSSLTTTITHSPMQDYFCYYCDKYKQYCSYCKVAPTRLYYSQYYADYFTSYYSQYYVNYFSEPGFPDWKGDKYPNAQFGNPDYAVPSDPGSPTQGAPSAGSFGTFANAAAANTMAN